MTPKQFLLRMHERAPWESPNVYNRDYELLKHVLGNKLAIVIPENP
jgi:hypothetical protein